jgi:hypothetical protein
MSATNGSQEPNGDSDLAKTQQIKTWWACLYERLQNEGVDYFLDSQLRPTVLIPKDRIRKEWPVDSQRFRDLLVSLYFELYKDEILKPAQTDFILAQLREEARQGGQRLTEEESVQTDRDVVVQAILSLMNGRQEFRERTVELVKELRRIQASGTISYDDIPVFTNIFVRRLNRLLPVLRGYGILATVEHKEDGSHCLLKRLPSFQIEPASMTTPDAVSGEPPGQSSGASCRRGADLQQPDGADDSIRFDAAPKPRSTPASSPTGNENGGVK